MSSREASCRSSSRDWRSEPSLVVVLVVAAFRDWRLSLYALLPTAIGLTWAAGALAIAGVELDLFAVFAVVTFIGIGVDYGIHLVHRYHERGDAERATAELAPVILSAAAITLGGYGTLIWSSYPPLRSIGIVSAASTVALAAASVLVLPALLLSAPRPARDRSSRTTRPALRHDETHEPPPSFRRSTKPDRSRKSSTAFAEPSITSSWWTMGRRMGRRNARARPAPK